MGIEETRKQVEQELQEAEQLVLRLRSKRNTLIPVCRLPTDILCQIFLEIASPPPHTHFNSYLCHHDDHDMIVQYKWITITHICQRFRHVAISYPLLWTCLPLYSTPLHRTFLKRSKGVPGLCLHMQEDTRRASRLMRNVKFTLKNFMHRVGTLHIVASAEDLQEFFSRAKTAAPYLEELSLANTTIDDEPVELPDKLFSGQTPRLRTMQLDNILILGPPASCLTGLTSLKISYAEHFPILYVAEILAANPNLEHLTLDLPQFCFPSTLTQLKPISLPVLDTLLLAGDIDACVRLLNILVLPGSTTLNWRCLLNHPESLMNAASVIGKHITRNSSTAIDTLSIAHSDEIGSDILQLGCLHLLKRASTAGHAERFIHIIFELASEEALLHKYVLLENILSLTEALPLSDLQHVSLIALRSENFVRELSTESQAFPSQTISIFGNPSFFLIRALLEPESQILKSLLPKVHTLHIEETSFIHGINPLGEDDEVFIDLLPELLEEETLISTIKIVKCKAVGRDMVHRLEEVVDTVLCNNMFSLGMSNRIGLDGNSPAVPPLPPCPIQ